MSCPIDNRNDYVPLCDGYFDDDYRGSRNTSNQALHNKEYGSLLLPFTWQTTSYRPCCHSLYFVDFLVATQTVICFGVFLPPTAFYFYFFAIACRIAERP